MFVPEKNLKDLVVSYVRSEERSISALTKALEADGHSFHRLFVTGYLRALSDVGMLREKEIPPAKVYTASAHREQNLYELVGELSLRDTADESAHARLAVAVLQKVLRRPIFLRELRECGLAGAIDAPAVGRDEREETRRALLKLGLEIPSNEPAYRVDDRRNEARDALLCELIVRRFGLASLVLDTKQMKLTER